MKFNIDNQLPPALASWLIGKRHDAEHVFPLGVAEASDAAIWDFAVSQGASVITKDSDFAERRMQSANGPTVIWMRIGNVATATLLAKLELAWPNIEAGLAASQAIIEIR